MNTSKIEKTKEPKAGNNTGSKTLSSGSDDSYERVELARNNSVMIYDDVMAVKDQGQFTESKVILPVLLKS